MVQKKTSQKLEPYVHEGKSWDYFFVDTKTGIIYYERRLDGKHVKFSCKTDSGNAAKIFANKKLAGGIKKKVRRVRGLIADELKLFLAFKESEGWKYDTLNNIKRAVKQIKPFWGDRLPSEINRDSFAEWCKWWKKNNPEIEMENAVKYFNAFCVYLHEKVENDRPLLPVAIRFQDPNRHEIESERALKKETVPTPEQVRVIRSFAENSDEALVVLFMETMATRIDETLRLEFETRILLDREVPLYRWTYGSNKAKKVGEHALHLALIEPLRELRERRRAEGTNLLFPQKLNNQKPLREQQIDWAGWRKRAGLSLHWTPHIFRHYCLTHLFNDPRNPQAILCKQYRVSLQVALKYYIKTTPEAMLTVRDSIRVII